jgi:outer membrane murein-binding lipoprotein Lpp
MKSLACVLFATVVAAGCENSSKLDPAVGGSGGSLEARVAKLEAENAKYKEAFEYLQMAYNQAKQGQQQQQAQQQQREEQEPDPAAQFAVDVVPDVKGGQVDGPNSACVTVVEAWDFA